MSTSIDATRNLVRLLIILALLLGLSVTGHAQVLGFFGDKSPVLDRADLIQADQAARRLLRPQPAALGTSETWAEPTSGDSGTLTLERAYQSHGRNCRAVRWHDVFKSGAERSLLLDTCLVAGRWRLM